MYRLKETIDSLMWMQFIFSGVTQSSWALQVQASVYGTMYKQASLTRILLWDSCCAVATLHWFIYTSVLVTAWKGHVDFLSICPILVQVTSEWGLQETSSNLAQTFSWTKGWDRCSKVIVQDHLTDITNHVFWLYFINTYNNYGIISIKTRSKVNFTVTHWML